MWCVVMVGGMGWDGIGWNGTEQMLTLVNWVPGMSMIIILSKYAWTGAITAQGPPCFCTKADGSTSLKSKPTRKTHAHTQKETHTDEHSGYTIAYRCREYARMHTHTQTWPTPTPTHRRALPLNRYVYWKARAPSISDGAGHGGHGGVGGATARTYLETNAWIHLRAHCRPTATA